MYYVNFKDDAQGREAIRSYKWNEEEKDQRDYYGFITLV